MRCTGILDLHTFSIVYTSRLLLCCIFGLLLRCVKSVACYFFLVYTLHKDISLLASNANTLLCRYVVNNGDFEHNMDIYFIFWWYFKMHLAKTVKCYIFCVSFDYSKINWRLSFSIELFNIVLYHFLRLNSTKKHCFTLLF